MPSRRVNPLNSAAEISSTAWVNTSFKVPVIKRAANGNASGQDFLPR
ncbi:Uncharacterised protein [Salmonella enterica subsp. enterica serovar Bovismorbificans]|uniref:Uncharacterized protein n=1 Tax=Salmonella enterica subsp. enterica serovar Bovismorbificans TaxID=58097 RepID=A0A655EJ13_SALET|nr:Uncharacterised protein [Salmonella enterica subsp. enterica serovar Bovismorbificans]